MLVVIAPWGEVSVILLPCFLMLCTPCVIKQMSYTFFPLIKFYLIRLSLAHSVQKIQIVSIYILLPPFFHITLLFYLCLYICCSCFFSHLFFLIPFSPSTHNLVPKFYCQLKFYKKETQRNSQNNTASTVNRIKN